MLKIFVILTQKKIEIEYRNGKKGILIINAQIRRAQDVSIINVYCACVMITELEQNINDRNGKKGTLKLIHDKKGTRCKCKINVCCACEMINELEQNLNDIVQKNLTCMFFDTSTIESMVSHMHY